MEFLLGRALTKVQRKIILDLMGREYRSKSMACREISRKFGIPISTVKYNYSVLEKARIVNGGKLLLRALGELVH